VHQNNLKFSVRVVANSSTSAYLQTLVMSDVTRILTQIEHGDSQAAEQLLPLVYDELRKLAAAKLSYVARDGHIGPTRILRLTQVTFEGKF
jgi:hypothetical protein